ncbi:transglutaminase family protein [Kaistia dalseonensis]|uniref:Transglutaminase-like putative cysteine protease n=1 Tax=Kaistia dalseonensis TaxID=410840 RepID=A0ABU0HBC2_9HYPH|nr:transglutaminase family protein [Kaistia dalseonensis]MCX5496980.1 transglutaminase family protein [Kaistia dalseonensis]MDQ0439606.1 transglutaminase-like putative cysteine protease [Kaistia dalseonensis]
MRLRIVHETAYSYDPPATGAIQTLRLTPRGHDGQFVINWRIEVDHDCRLDTASDPFGNVVQSFTTEGRLDGLVITALGEVETHDMAGMVRGQSERFPTAVFLRDTPLTESNAALRTFALDVNASAPADRLSKLHVLMGAIHEAIAVETTDHDDAIRTFESAKGDPRAIAHVFIAAARHLGIPTRYASGYLYRPDDSEPVSAEHGWAEALIDGVGWIGFDATMNLCPTDYYVRLAIGLDRVGAAPVRGTAYGDGAAVPRVSILVSEARAAKR